MNSAGRFIREGGGWGVIEMAVLHYAYFTTEDDVNISAKLNHLNVHPLKVVSRYRDPQLKKQQKITHNYLFNLWPIIYKYWWLNTHFHPDNCDCSANKTDYKRL